MSEFQGCGSHHNGWVCTRSKGHVGEHWATSELESLPSPMGRVYDTWHSSEADGRRAFVTAQARGGTERVVEKVVTKLPSVDELAYALFVTDTDVIIFARQVYDGVLRRGPGNYEASTGKLGTTLRRMWERNERGWRDTYIARACDVLSALERGT